MTKFSTNALTARYCESRGWQADTVQSWRGNQRHDLFHLFDTVAVIDREVYFIQNCSSGTLKAHRDKLWDSFGLIQQLRDAGIVIELWEWKRKKANGRYQWFLRTETFGADKPEAWEGPFGLYPKKKRERELLPEG